MSGGRRLVAALGVAAAILLIGRGAALLFAQSAWFGALGAASVWRDEVISTTILFAIALVTGTIFAWLNVSAVRRSIVALIVPKRVGDMAIGEEIPSTRLRIVTIAMSLFIAGVSTLALPSWTVLARWRSGVSFGELDPYFQLDLSHYVTWLPLERAAYDWATVLFAIVALLVVALYSLTPSLRWTRRGVRATTHARRHIAVLGAILLLLAAWSFRLAAFELLSNGSGAGGTFTRTDHVWLVPADVVLSIGTLGLALVLLAAGWMGQTGMALAAVTVVLVAAAGARLVGPVVSAARAAQPDASRLEAPYLDTRDIYTARAFQRPATLPSMRFAADSGVLAAASRATVQGARLPAIVYPGALGTLILPDSLHQLRAPRLGSGFARLMHAWALQDPQLLTDNLPADAAIVRERELRQRLAALVPGFLQSRSIGAIPSATGIVWVVDLFATSEHYPLAAGQDVGGQRITYSHHAATAFVNGGTGAVAVVPDPVQDPIGGAWFAAHPGPYITPTLPPSFTAPPPAPAAPSATPLSHADSTFRAHVTAVYDRMRAALDSGNLARFGAAFDSLGRLVHQAGAPR